ncbi:MAG: GTP-binding protein, partial [Bacteroidales bacterium]|nr:GTP-binding protein [Bacteroidales bacterium]
MDKAGHVNKIPFFLITGFLGSGKTTLLNRVIQQFSSSYRLGIIQNEFAQGIVDGQELKRS